MKGRDVSISSASSRSADWNEDVVAGAAAAILDVGA